MAITKDLIIGDVLDKYPETAELFLQMGMHCLGCPAARGETIEEACQVHSGNRSRPTECSEERIDYDLPSVRPHFMARGCFSNIYNVYFL